MVQIFIINYFMLEIIIDQIFIKEGHIDNHLDLVANKIK